MSSAQEQRRSSRYEISLRILFRRADSACFYETRTENISVHGVFIATKSQRLEIGTQVILMLTGEQFGDGIPIKGRVSWARRAALELGGPAGMGIDFEDLADEQRQLIGEALKRVVESDGEG